MHDIIQVQEKLPIRTTNFLNVLQRMNLYRNLRVEK